MADPKYSNRFEIRMKIETNQDAGDVGDWFLETLNSSVTSPTNDRDDAGRLVGGIRIDDLGRSSPITSWDDVEAALKSQPHEGDVG